MTVLKNAKHERFAQALAEGLVTDNAYVKAGYTSNRGNANSLKHKEHISIRVSELLVERNQIDKEATERAIKSLSITKERIAAELASIAFADIRKAVRWGKSPIDTISENADPNGLTIYPVELIPSELIDDATAAAVSEVSLTTNGIKIKMYDKRSALVDLAKMMGFVTEKHEHTGDLNLIVSSEDAEL